MDMDIKNTIESTIAGFSSYPISGSEKEAEYKAFVDAIYRLGESSSDLSQFINQYYDGELIQKENELHNYFSVVMMNQQAQEQRENSTNPALPTVQTFLEPHRMAYEEIKKYPYRKKTLEIYEKILGIANQTDDIMEAQLILEDQQFFSQLAMVGFEEMEELQKAPMDPLDEVLINNAFADPLDMRNYHKKMDQCRQKRYGGEVKLLLFAAFVIIILSYEARKRGARQWGDSTVAKANVLKMNQNLKDLKTMVPLLEKVFGKTVEELMQEQYIKTVLLGSVAMVPMGRVKKAAHPQNLLAIKEITQEEIRSDLPLEDLICRESEYYFYFDLDKNRKSVEEEYRRWANEHVKDFDFFKYNTNSGTGDSLAGYETSMGLEEKIDKMDEMARMAKNFFSW